MGVATLLIPACLLVVVASQAIVYNSFFCIDFGLDLKLNESYETQLQEQLGYSLRGTASKLETRWRIVTFYKNVLAKIKPKLAAAKFNDIKKLLWEGDKTALHNAMYSFDDWKTKAIDAITNAAKKIEIRKIINNLETANKSWDDDKRAWMPGMGFRKCSLK
ncbi:hypothetical protein PENTCL1PPCAC_28819 [Pristionchus entomophagus]|uniref:SXP/RAL-2 family protein Ani s 5-like cation-binding domain-containing protein n=1 Tax=Pristionchus entomophagus TaxID=358040 RepID=A0AAV5UL25_9BILA|nr:hypothetical protein PENTCL1PPCAC_28819 [Pristionchus entomophagus]